MSSSDELKRKYDTLYQDLKEFYLDTTNGKLSLNTITILTRFAMEHVQTHTLWANLKGSEKKDLVVSVVTDFINDMLNDTDKVDEETKRILQNGLEMVPMLIDAAVDFAKVYSKFKQVLGFDNKKKWCCWK
jgi:hypothetical protein